MRAWTPGAPSRRSRPRISPAARVVKVTARHLGGLVDPGRDAVGDPVGDRPGLAGAGAGEHPHRPAQRLGDLALLGVERLEQVVGVGHAGTTPPSVRFSLCDVQKP